MTHITWRAKTNFCFQNEKKNEHLGLSISLKNSNSGLVNNGNILVSKQVNEDDLKIISEKIKASLLITGLKNGNGIHLGTIGGKSYLSKDALKEIADKAGVNATRNLHYGLNIAKDFIIGDKWVLGESLNAFVSVSEDIIIEDILRINNLTNSLKSELVNGLEIWNVSRFYPNSMGRYLLNICAIECVFEHSAINDSILDWVNNSIKEFEKIECESEDKNLFKQRLEHLRKDSISNAGRNLFRRIFPDDIAGKEAGKYFTEIYNIRSQMVHSGKYDQQSIPQNFENIVWELFKRLVKEQIEEIEFDK